MQSVVITGASTGIGWATAKLLLDRGFRVFGSVRKAADTDRLGHEIGANFTPLLFDVTEEAAVLGGETLCGLVNNAGIAVAGPVLELSVDEFRRQVDVNVIGSIIATQAFGPLLGSDPSLKGKPGRIVMISSVAARMAPRCCRPIQPRSTEFGPGLQGRACASSKITDPCGATAGLANGRKGRRRPFRIEGRCETSRPALCVARSTVRPGLN